MKWSRCFVETAPSVTGARRFVAETLSTLPADVQATAALLVSELATNAVLHATSAFEVTVTYPTRTGTVRVEVADDERSRPTPLNPPPSALHGRGLLLVESLAARWGVRHSRRRVGKTVWFELALPAAEVARPRRAGSLALGRRPRRGRSSLFDALSPGWSALFA
jgi:two-component sensor histidine kinase